jgi:hypothetical protein
MDVQNFNGECRLKNRWNDKCTLGLKGRYVLSVLVSGCSGLSLVCHVMVLVSEG